MSENDQTYVVKLTGLPFHAKVEDVAVFLAGLDIKGGKRAGVHFTKEESGRPSGEAFVELLCKEDANQALSKDHEYMGERWIGVTRVSFDAMQDEINKVDEYQKKLDDKGEYIVKIRGLPWSTTAADIETFFAGSHLKEEASSSVHLVKNFEGKASGQGYVEFIDADSLNSALAKNKQHMGKRYLEISRADSSEMSRSMSSSRIERVVPPRGPPSTGPFNVGGDGDELVCMLRGLPFKVTEEEIHDFFAGIAIVDIQLVYDRMGTKPMGKAFVEFGNEADFKTAFEKDHEKIGSRYVEIFKSSRMNWTSREGVNEYNAPNSGRRSLSRPSPYDRRPSPMSGRGKTPRGMGGFDGADGYSPYGESYGGREGYGSMGARGGAGAAPAAAPAAGPTKHIVLVKGVSNDTSIGDVIKLFSDPGTPKNVEMKYGEAVVEFHSHAEAMQAMLKDKSMLAGRSVRLELQSKPEDYSGYEGVKARGYSDPYVGTGTTGAYNDPYQAQQTQGEYRW